MSWPNELRPASFRGLAFEAMMLGESGGQRLVVDELPESDDHTVGELGIKADTFRLAGFVKGDDYLDQIGNLKAAFRKRGAGELVHPWRGLMQVFVEDWTFSYDTGGGLGDFEITCRPAGLETRPTVLVVTETDVIEKGETARATSYEEDAVAAYSAVLTALPKYMQAVASLAFMAEYTDLLRLLGLPYDSAAVVQIAATREALIETVDAVEDLTALIRYLTRPASNVPSSSGTDASDAMVEAVAAGLLSIRIVALTRACDLALEREYVSADAADEMQRILTEIIDAELDLEPDDETFTALCDLRTSLSAAMLDTAARLPRERIERVAAPVSALVLAFRLYGDVEREEEILQLNGAGHPGFLSGELTVLSS